MKNLLFFLILLFLASCTSQNTNEKSNHTQNSINEKTKKIANKNPEKSSEKKSNTEPKTNRNGYYKIHTLKKKDKTIIGDVYIKPITEKVFGSLFIIKENESKIDTLYLIKKNKFFNKNGLDIEVIDDNCYEFKLVLLKDNYIIVNSICREKATVSDDIKIEWNEDKGIMEVWKI